MTQEKFTPWYKEPYMLLVAGIPVIAVIWGLNMVRLALDAPDTLVSDSYYKDGVTFTESYKLDQAADRLQAEAVMTFNTDEISLNLTGYFDTQPNTLQLELIHPTLEDRDVTVLLQRMPDGRFMGVNEIELPARRHVWLNSPEQGWRLRLTHFIESDKAFTLSYK